jgi:CxxC motif-containing protein (DUF1111 family)
MTRYRRLAVLAVSTALLVGACGSDGVVRVGPDLGGAATVDDTSRSAFARPIPSLTSEERRAFFVGNSFFNDNWVTAPASTEGRDGLGPVFNAQSCSACHFRDGRGVPPDDDPTAPGLLLRLSIPGGEPDPVYGDQLQDRANGGVEPEGRMIITYAEHMVAMADGTTETLALPQYAIDELSAGPLDPEVMISPRLAPQLPGVGLLEAIPADTILALADPDDADGDGISGRPNMVVDLRTGQMVIGRFGWKANVATVEQQNAGAFRGDIGITSSLFPDEACTAAQLDCLEAPSGGAPELDDAKLGRVTFYTQTLAVPARRNPDDPQVRRGEEVFAEIGCDSCHVPTMETGASPIDQLANQTIHPFTDMLLHDMGRGLADGRPDGEATGTEWRTPPLWGLGMIAVVSDDPRYLHDGRARTIDEAILWHDGEAATARIAYGELSTLDIEALHAFLEDL